MLFCSYKPKQPISKKFKLCVSGLRMHGRTERRTDSGTDTSSYRDARTHLKGEFWSQWELMFLPRDGEQKGKERKTEKKNEEEKGKCAQKG